MSGCQAICFKLGSQSELIRQSIPPMASVDRFETLLVVRVVGNFRHLTPLVVALIWAAMVLALLYVTLASSRKRQSMPFASIHRMILLTASRLANPAPLMLREAIFRWTSVPGTRAVWGFSTSSDQFSVKVSVREVGVGGRSKGTSVFIFGALNFGVGGNRSFSQAFWLFVVL